jgi:HD-GYP domain-containing protein (c-di-GMP phosphodiesterase class II)
MLDQRDHLVGVLALVNRKRFRDAKIVDKESADRYALPYRARDIRVARSLASQAAVAIENVQLYAQVEQTLEGVVKTAVSAIDERDPATAGHSMRVADMTVGLARAVERVGSGPYKGVRFTPRQIRELRFAALLHDLGKVAVREEVLVKARKLPPVLWERVDARFDLIQRTMELEHCQSGRSDGELKEQIEELQRMRAIVLQANEPSVLAEEPSAALAQIARLTFERPDGHVAPYLAKEELQYLQLPRGTLDDRERAEVESHAEATYRLLSHIPWTEDLMHVADYARGHHEKLNGRGYPRGLTADDIPVQTRLITLADIFDALTEGHRWYKPPVSVDRAFDMLWREVDEGLLDGELVRVALESGAFTEVLKGDWRTF